MESFDIIIIGAGIFGVTAAIELKQRQPSANILLVDPGPLPHRNAASTDISKIIRMDYGSDELYTEMMEEAFPIWRQWNVEFGEKLYHETGILILGRDLSLNAFEGASLQVLNKRGYVPKIKPMSVEEVAARFPAFKTSNLGGYLNPVAGWAESGRVVLKLTEKAQSMGVVVRQVATTKVLTRQGISGKKAVEGIQTSDGKVISSPQVVVAAGASTPWLLPQLREFMWASAQPVLHFARPANSPHYDPVQFIVYAYETAKSGFYGFPCHPSDQRIKIGNHGRGYKLLEVTDESLAALWKKVQPFETKRFRDFCKQSFPDLVDAPIIFTRLCCYCDTFDGNFWIDRDPSTDGLTVAAGGSGHGFKFGPVLGRLIADAVEGKKNKWGDRFLWRTPQPGVFVKEEMRNLNSPTSSL